MIFKRFKKLMSSGQGFTMIELLIVIAVLGILAVAVLSALNPIEQINRGKDTGSRSDVEQLISATDRYYTSKGYYPWMTNAQSVNYAITPMVAIATAAQAFGVDVQPMLTRLSSGGTEEIKESFVTRIIGIDVTRLWIYHNNLSSGATYVCFIPKSGSFREEAWNRCKVILPGDFPPTACPVGPTCTTAATSATATGCYICLP